jgi:DnaK suppressor protein
MLKGLLGKILRPERNDISPNPQRDKHLPEIEVDSMAAKRSSTSKTSKAGKKSSSGSKSPAKKKTASKTASTKKMSKTKASAKKAAKKAPAKKASTKTAAKKTASKKSRAKAALAKTKAKKTATKSSASKRKTDSRLAGGITPYKTKSGESYMSDDQKVHFRNLLLAWKSELMEEVDRTVSHMKDEAANFPDPADRATQEEEFSLELRARDRERKLIKKIDSTLELLESDDYGYCEACGIEIGVQRLEARPTATLCIDCKTLAEIKERQLGT